MEAEPLTGPPLSGPPLIVESAVQLLIPPAARETVVGDLREIYNEPAQYAVEGVADRAAGDPRLRPVRAPR